MRWPTRKTPTMKAGDRRTVTYFAWLPVECDNGVTLWLERYSVRQVREFEFSDGNWPNRLAWTDVLRVPLTIERAMQEIEGRAVAA